MLLGFFLGAPGSTELIVCAVIALLLFGKRLPEVARSLGKGIVEFKKGVSGLEDEVNHSTQQAATQTRSTIEDNDDDEMTAPKFEPPTSEPKSSDDA